MNLGKIRTLVLYAFWNCINKTQMKFKRCHVGTKLKTRGLIRMINRGSIIIGDDVTINSMIMANPIGGNPCSIIVALKGAQIKIGTHTGLSNSTLFASENIEIGSDVLIGAGTKIYDNDFHPISFDERMNKTKPKSKPVIIHEGVFIGAHSIILKGVEIGEYAVIGAGSVVTKSVPANQVWAGNPAQFIKYVES